jgi:hypothetical protein
MPERTSMECIVYDMRRAKEMAVLTGHVYFAFQSVVTYLAQLHFLHYSWY